MCLYYFYMKEVEFSENLIPQIIILIIREHNVQLNVLSLYTLQTVDID